MRRFQTLTIGFLCSTFLITCSNSGCESSSTHESTAVRNVFCNGNSVSTVITQSTKVRGEKPLSHKYGYLISEINHSWIINWNIEKNGEAGLIPSIHYLGQFNRGQGRTKEKQITVVPSSIFGLGIPDTVLLLDWELRVLKNGIKNKSIESQKSEGYILSRSREHIFSLEQEPRIYSLPSLNVTKKLSLTKDFKKFLKSYQWRENQSEILTDDLSFLIVVPRNGISETDTSGHQHTKAFCYQINEDVFSTRTLNGLGEATILDAGIVNGELHWLVSKQSDEKLFILDSQSKILSEVSLPNMFRKHYFWHPNDSLIWCVNTQKLGGQSLTINPEISIMKHNIKDGTQVKFELPAYDELVVPE